MDAFRRAAFEAICRDAAFVTLATLLLMIGFSFHLPLALLIGGNVAILFALAALFRATRLTGERIAHSEPWLSLERRQCPTGEEGRWQAVLVLRDVCFRAAKAASVVAIALMTLSLVASSFHGAPSQAFAVDREHRIVTAVLR